MEYFKDYKVIWFAVAIFVVASAIVYYTVPTFAGSNIFTGIATFIVGCFAIGIYIRQKSDEKIDAANILLVEIRNAEKIIQQIKTTGTVSLYTKVFSNNSWNKYNYLFIKDLDPDELEALNNFYNQTVSLDEFIEQVNSLPSQISAKGVHIQECLLQLAKDSISEADYKNKRDAFLSIADKETFWFQPAAPKDSLKRAVDIIDTLTITTVGTKLKKIAKIK